MKINGEKWACLSCIKGHRVSGCTHEDRDLQHVNPKGRPVKQCEHCRGARKTNSHHTKCDCGNDNDSKNKIKAEGNGCCCGNGETCVCGNKAELAEARFESSLKRQNMPVRSRPRLKNSISETSVPQFNSGSHKSPSTPTTAGHAVAGPYKITKPRSLHGADYSAHRSRRSIGGSRDLRTPVDDEEEETQTATNPIMNHNRLGSQQIVIPTLTPTEATPNFYSVQADPPSTASSDSLNMTPLDSFSWFHAPQTVLSDLASDMLASPMNQDFFNTDCGIPNAPNLWEPSDLPFISNRSFPGYQQPISHSEESGYQSGPTFAASSGARSEAGPPLEGDLMSGWPENLTIQESDNIPLPTVPTSATFDPFSSLNSGNMMDFGGYQIDMGHRAMLGRTHRLSDSTAVPDTSLLDQATANLSPLDARALFMESTGGLANPNLDMSTMNSSPPISRVASITIPVDTDDSNEGWYTPANVVNTNVHPSIHYPWAADGHHQ